MKLSKKSIYLGGSVVGVFVVALVLWNGRNGGVKRKIPTGSGQVTASSEPTGNLTSIPDDEVPLKDKAATVVYETDADRNIIPDKQNTGAKGKLKKVELGTLVEGVKMKIDGTGTKNVFDFGYGNKNISGTVCFENYDFSDYEVALYNEAKVDRKIELVFKNCAFSRFSKGAGQSLVQCEFINCSFQNFNGANAVFDHCHFGGSFSDGLNPFNDVKVSNCYFSDMNDFAEAGGGKHTDGTQIYGKKDVCVENVFYENCRFEIPALATTDGGAAVNACIMLQLEYSSGRNIHFTNCILNGGGYSLFARSVKSEYTLNNVTFDNIQFGCSKRFGSIYPDISDGISIKKLSDINKLYVSSVWEENGKVHFYVSNDTNQERKLWVYTEKGRTEYIIPACPNGEQVAKLTNLEQFPIDIEYTIPKGCKYAVFYDATLEGMPEQIRFVNWNGGKVYVDLPKNEVAVNTQKYVLEGNCGKSVSFSLTQDGVLIIKGSGSTDDYHSAKPVPWADYKYFIRMVIVEEGVTRLGNQLFNKFSAISKVELPEGLVKLGGRTFAGCTSLLEIHFPSTLNELGNSTFTSSAVMDVYCTEAQYELFSQDAAIGRRLRITDSK